MHDMIRGKSVTIKGDLTAASLTKQIDAIHRECEQLKSKRTDLTEQRLRGDTKAATQIDDIDISLFKAEREVSSLIELRKRLAAPPKHDWRKFLPHMIKIYKFEMIDKWRAKRISINNLLLSYQPHDLRQLRDTLDELNTQSFEAARTAADRAIPNSWYRTFVDVGKFHYRDTREQDAARNRDINEAAQAILEAAPTQGMPQELVELIAKANIRLEVQS